MGLGEHLVELELESGLAGVGLREHLVEFESGLAGVGLGEHLVEFESRI